MATLRIYNDIVDEEEKVFLRDCVGTDGICYKDIQEFLDSMDEDDNLIDIRIHCRGGDCLEGWAIYDALRRSSKIISATVEGECSSMATIVLLAAPAERRSAYKNCHMCLHNPAVEYLPLDYYDRLTPDNLEDIADTINTQAKALREEQDKILDLYVERTGANRKALQALMDKEIYIDADRAQELGFISTILVPTTASTRRKSIHKHNSNSQMAKPRKNMVVSKSVISRLLAKAGLARIEDLKMKDQVVTAADGAELTIEREDGDPQIGDIAYPDGTYVLDDGTTIVVEGEVITNIISNDEPNEPDARATSEDPEEIKALIAELQAKLAELEPDEPTSEETIDELEKKVEELEETVAEQAEALKGARKLSASEKQILAKVAKAGGLAWLDKVTGMRSTFTPSNRRFVEHGAGSAATATESKTQKAIRERREAAEKKRANRK